MQDPRDELRQKVLEYFYETYNQTPTKVLLPDEAVQHLITYNREEVFAAIEFLAEEKYLKLKQTGRDFGYIITPKEFLHLRVGV
jgi:hypothetical protein